MAVPRFVPLEQKALDVRCGDDYALVLLADGSVVGFGNTMEFRMGDGRFDQVDMKEMPVTVFSAENLSKHNIVIKDFAAGSSHSLFLVEHVNDVKQRLANYEKLSAGKIDPSSSSSSASSSKKVLDQKRNVPEGKKKVVGKRVKRDAKGNAIGQGRPSKKSKKTSVKSKKTSGKKSRKATKKKASRK